MDTPADRACVALRRLLREERFHPGESLGSERALAERLGVGRTVLRQALERLEDEGVLRRSLGRHGGVFAHDGRLERHLNTTLGVPEMVRRQGLQVATRVLGATLGLAWPDEVRNLRLAPDEPVVRVVRLRLVEGVPWSLDTSVLPSRRYPGLLHHDLTGSLYAVLTGEYGLELDHADETVEAVPADGERAGLLEVPPGSPLLEFRRVAHQVDGSPVEYAHDFFRADRTRVHLRELGTNWKRTVRRSRGDSTGR